MVQINLPKNSEVKKGIYYKDKTEIKKYKKSKCIQMGSFNREKTLD